MPRVPVPAVAPDLFVLPFLLLEAIALRRRPSVPPVVPLAVVGRESRQRADQLKLGLHPLFGREWPGGGFGGAEVVGVDR